LDIDQLSKKPAAQKKIAESKLGGFINLYLRHYLKFPIPRFHWWIYSDLEDDDIGFLILTAFRDSAKSTIASLAYPLWSAITGKKKFIIICSDSFTQAKLLITNIIHELNDNEKLIEHFGPFNLLKAISDLLSSQSSIGLGSKRDFKFSLN